MSNSVTKVMLDAFKEEREPLGFLSSQFKVPRKGIHSQEKVEIDIKRSGRKIAVALHDLSTGARMNAKDIFSNKEFAPAILKEATVIDAFQLMGRSFGQLPYESNDFRGKLLEKAMDTGIEMSNKIARTCELQASQILTTGKITLKDEAGKDVYVLDFKPKTSHFPTASVSWDNANADPVGDILSLCREVKKNGKQSPDMMELGEDAYEYLIKNDEVKARLDNRRLEGSGIKTLEKMDNGAEYRGILEVGSYKLHIYTYSEVYEDPETEELVNYLPTDKVIIRSSRGRLDATFGIIPKIGGRDPRLPSGLFERVKSGPDMIDIQIWAQIKGNSDGVEIEVGTRPLLIPVAIDTFGCLTIGI